MKLKKLVALCAATAIVTAACGSDDSGKASSSAPAPASSSEVAAPSSSEPAPASSGSESSAASPTGSAGESPASSSGEPSSSAAAPGVGTPVDCKAEADGPLAYATDKAAWKPDFEAMNELSTKDCGLSVNVTGYSDPAQYDAFIKQGFQTDKKPTLFTWHTGGQLKELVDQGLVAETTDLWKKATENGDVPEGLIDNYTYDGKQYCVPLNVAYWALYYNKKIFADNKLTPPTTWEELMKVSDALVAKGITPFHQMNFIFEFVWFQAILAGMAPDTYAGLGTGDAKYTDQPVKDTMKVWYEMMNKKYFIDPGVQTDPQTLLKTGKVAMAYFGTFFTGQLTQVGMKSDQDYGVIVVPSYKADVKQQMIVETGPLCVGAGSPNEKGALAYSAWWFGQGAQTAWSTKRGDVSFNPKVKTTDPALAKLLEGQADWQVQKRWLEATPNPIYTVASPLFGEYVTKPKPDATDILDKIQAEADSYWAENK